MLLPRRNELMLCAFIPRAMPTTDGFCSFRGQVSALRGDWECVKLGGWCIENDGTRGSEIVGPNEQGKTIILLY